MTGWRSAGDLRAAGTRHPEVRLIAGADGTDGQADLWLVDLTLPPSPREIGDLSGDERRRAARFRFAEHRDRYLAAHCAVRRLIARTTGVTADRQQFAYGDAGKPVMIGCPPLHFSLSYAGAFALIGLSRTAGIGVDLEGIRPIDDVEELAETHFTQEECAALSAVAPGTLRQRAFLCGWTRKEACVKAVGSGLSANTARFESGIGAGRQIVHMAVESGEIAAEVRSLTPAAGLIGAWSLLVADRRSSQ